MAAGIKEVEEDPGYINLVYDYEEVIQEITKSSLVQVNHTSSQIPEINFNVNLLEVDQANLTKIEKIVQNRLETLSDIITIEDEDPQEVITDSKIID